MNAEALREALEGNRNEYIYETTNEIIQAKKIRLFQGMGMSREEISQTMNILKEYKWIESLRELIEGRYLRWIDTRISEEENYFVERGGIFCRLEKASTKGKKKARLDDVSDDVSNNDDDEQDENEEDDEDLDNQEELYAICRNIGGKHFKLQMGSFLLFQKLTQQEQIILRAIDMLLRERRQRK